MTDVILSFDVYELFGVGICLVNFRSEFSTEFCIFVILLFLNGASYYKSSKYRTNFPMFSFSDRIIFLFLPHILALRIQTSYI